MNMDWLSIVALLGWLVLAISAFASFKLSWRKSLRYALIWAALFGGLAIFIAAVRG